MWRSISIILLLLISKVSWAFDMRNQEISKLFRIKNVDHIMETIAQKQLDEMDLCQKHSQIYLNERMGSTGWAFQSKYKYHSLAKC